MTKFDEIMTEYRRDVLNEADPAAAGGAPAPAPAPDPAMDPSAAAPAPEQEGPSPEDVVDELEKTSKKPWADLAGVLGRAMEYSWTEEDIQRVNHTLPGGLTLRDFVNVRSSPNIKDKYDANIVSAAVKLFDTVDKIMGEGDMEEIIPAEER